MVMEWWTEEDTRCEETFDGVTSRILQHEVDHLDGKLFVDHLSLVKRGIILRKMAKARRAQAQDA